MKKNAKIASERLKQVLLSDKIAQPEKFNELLKSEVVTVLSNYFELFPSTFEINLAISDNVIDITMRVKGGRIKPYGNFVTEIH
ncbi:MAG: cell division topological specificity factor MinE [Clostridia bacterium]